MAHLLTLGCHLAQWSAHRKTESKRFGFASGNDLSGKHGGFYRSMQHHLMDLLFKDGVYEPGETVETFSHTEN